MIVVVWGLTTHGKYSADGDEPHYLIVAESLLSDGDLDLANNYAQDDGRLFGHQGLLNDGHARLSRTGRLESVHDIGLPLMLVGPYALAKRVSGVVPERVLQRFRMNRGLFTYSVLSLFMTSITAAGSAFLVRAAAAGSRVPAHAALTVAMVMLSPPVLSHAFLVFPEVPAFAVTCAALYVAYCAGRRPGEGFRELMMIGAALGLLPWFHRKYSLLLLGLVFLVSSMRAETLRTLPRSRMVWLVGVFVAPVILLYAWTWQEWGNFGGPQLIEGSPLAIQGLHRGAIGLWMDREYGVLAYAPIYIVLPACLVVTAAWRLLIPFTLFYVPMASFTEWWGGFCPAARYVVPLMPLGAIVMARAMNSARIRLVFLTLAIPQIVINILVWQHPRWLWPQNTGSNPAMERLGAVGRWYETLLPSIRSGSDPFLNGGLLLLIVATCALAWWAHAQDRRSLAGPAVSSQERT